MKKLVAYMLALVMAMDLTVPTLAAEEPLKVGILSRLGVAEEDVDVQAREVAEEKGAEKYADSTFEMTYFDSLTEMTLALDAGRIDILSADEPTVEYILSRNDAYEAVYPVSEMSLSYSMLFLEENAELRDQFSEAIKAMQEDGTLGELAATYIDGVIAGDKIGAVEFPSIGEELSDGAGTVTVAVTGDLPPMDYVDDAGYAAGFNAAVLAEISRRLDVNIELTQASSGTRALALSTGQADAAFWVVTNDFSGQANDAPAGTVTSEPYYTAPICHMVLKDAQ